MFTLLLFILYGLVVGTVAKFLHPGRDPKGFFVTIGIGIIGSYVGGFINWLVGLSDDPFSMSGLIMGTVGAVIFLSIWKWNNR